MEKVLKATHILFALFIGLIIGGLIFSNKSAWLTGILLLVIDIIIGISLQYFFNKNKNESFSDEDEKDDK